MLWKEGVVFIVAIITFCDNSDVGSFEGEYRHVPLVFKGEDASIKEFPYFASLVGCGAAILSDKWLLTAAHCVDNPLKRNRAWVGGDRISNSQKLRYYTPIIHPEYRIVEGLPFNDIALLELEKKLEFTKKIKPIKLAKNTNGKDLEFVGKGLDEYNRPSLTIKKIELRKLTTQQCVDEIPPRYRQLLKYVPLLEKMSICARRIEDEAGICSGDSGSPLTYKNKLVGLASFTGNDHCRNTRLNFFTNVTHYLPWIKSITGIH